MTALNKTVTGNELRDTLLIEALVQCRNAGEPMTLPNIQARVPDDFNLGLDELDAMLKAMEPTPPADEVAAEPLVPEDDVRSRVVRLNNEIANERATCLALQERLRDARGRLARNITAFQIAFGAKLDHTANVKAYIASEQAMRAARARGEVTAENLNVNAPGPSLVDRMAFGHGGKHGTRAPSWRRGAYPSHMRGRVKLPSEA